MKTLKVEKTGCWGMIDGVFQQLPVGHEFVAADIPAAFAGRVSVVGEVEDKTSKWLHLAMMLQSRQSRQSRQNLPANRRRRNNHG